MNDANSTQQTDFVFRRVEDGLNFFGREVNGWYWLAILIPVLLLGLFYVGWMYRRDARSIPWYLATLLALLRCGVYAVLAFVFLLPALQTWDTSTSSSRVLLLFDVSGSMGSRDDLPIKAVPVDKLPTRMDKVLAFLGDEKVDFLGRVQKTNPIFSYRFGGQLDEQYVMSADGIQWSRKDWEAFRREPTAEDAPQGKAWKNEEWATWLRPEVLAEPEGLGEPEKVAFGRQRELIMRLRNATNVGDSTLTLLNREINNKLQGIVVFSDGHSTEGAAQAFRDLEERAKKAQIPIFVVAVGQDRPPIRIDITDLQTPEQARPEDEFPVRVEVNGEGLPNKEVKVALDIYKPGAKEKSHTLEETLKFQPGEPPHGQVEFKISAAKYAEQLAEPAEESEGKKPELLEGEWRVVARVAKDEQEVFLPPEHVSDPAPIRIVKRPIRVLLFAGGPTHEYQFVRTLLVREMDKRRAEVSIYVQPVPGQAQPRPGRVQDVPPERLLTQFPMLLQDEGQVSAEDKLYNLMAYDLILAFDPDWTLLSADQLEMINRWVGTHSGGLIVVGGPVNTVQLARPGANREKLKPILDLYPVVLQDSRILDLERSSAEPWRLNFPGATPEMEYLKLDEEPQAEPLDDWERFFTGLTKAEGGPNAQPLRGFYSYYPVERAKDAATVVATFSDPRARLVSTGKEQPYLVTMNYGSGKVVWLGSGEMRRLRQYRQMYFDRFYTKLCRYAGSGNLTRINRRVSLVMGRTFRVNNYITVEARIFGRDMLPLPQTARPTVRLTLPPGVSDKEVATRFEMKPKPSAGEWGGWFTTRFLARAPGDYGLEVKVEETGDVELGKFSVKEYNPELDNSRPDFGQLYSMASDAEPVLARIREDARKQVREYLGKGPQPEGEPAAAPGSGSTAATADKPKLYFDLKSAEVIPDCMVTKEETQKNRGPVRDIWDERFTFEKDPTAVVLAILIGLTVLAALGLGVATGLTLSRGGSVATLVTSLLICGVLLLALVPLLVLVRSEAWPNPEVAILLLVVVPLLGVEWFVRKMLRLA